jgi:hypothetical protein
VEARRLDDRLGLGVVYLVREGKLKHRAPRDIASAVTRTAEAVVYLRGLVDLRPAGGWRVRLVVDTDMLLDDPEVTVCKDVISPRCMVHRLPAVSRELGDPKRAGRNEAKGCASTAMFVPVHGSSATCRHAPVMHFARDCAASGMPGEVRMMGVGRGKVEYVVAWPGSPSNWQLWRLSHGSSRSPTAGLRT